MIGGITNRGKMILLGLLRSSPALPANCYVALLRPTTVPDPDDEAAVKAFFADVNLMSDVVQVPTGNGYTDGGYQLSPTVIDYPTLTEDDTNNRADLLTKDIVWTASGGALPNGADADGTKGARFAVLTTNESPVANRQIIAWWDLTYNRVVSSGQTLTLNDPTLRLSNPA